jgi:Mg2+ and Co2+ transporter CorA
MTNSDITATLNYAKNIMRGLGSRYEAILSHVESLKDMEIENADIKQDIEDMINDISSKIEQMINEINSVT